MKNDSLTAVFRQAGAPDARYLSLFGREKAEQARAFHASFPGYGPTPLRDLRCLAEEAGVEAVYVKDESFRFGLNAFKALGGSYAVGSLLAERLGRPIAELPYDKMTGAEGKQALGEVTFVTATDGNHGRGVAWTAKLLGQKAVVYMPKGTATERLENIRALGADASILALGYDDCVRKAKADAEKNGWILVQDTAFEGYEEIPLHIMQGYMTMALEAFEQMGARRPTHLFLQAGVGSMAAAAAAFFAAVSPERCPVVTVVEPHTADCFVLTAQANDGKLHACEGEMHTAMAGLACGEVNPIAWKILGKLASCFVAMPDAFAFDGMRRLAQPLGDDPAVVSGESGASAFGLALHVLRDPEMADIRERLGIGSDSVILCFSTEGDTDRENYRRIVASEAVL